MNACVNITTFLTIVILLTFFILFLHLLKNYLGNLCSSAIAAECDWSVTNKCSFAHITFAQNLNHF
jgi:hypothetical protein